MAICLSSRSPVPEPESEDHAVDAGDAAFAFALPQPTVTHVPFVAPVTTDHAVNAGDASFAFAAPEPTVTHTSAPRQALSASPFP